MSIPVEIERLREQIERFGPSPYVLTVSSEARPHAVSINVLWDGDVLVASVGKKTVVNAAEHEAISLLWPPVENGGYSLIVDGVASVVRSDDGGTMRFEPTKGVLHRNAVAPSDATSGCGNDCVPIFAQAK
ncbi:MAG: hypothetical protein AB7L13_24085 [Acidimicrobiia bacterium]